MPLRHFFTLPSIPFGKHGGSVEREPACMCVDQNRKQTETRKPFKLSILPIYSQYNFHAKTARIGELVTTLTYEKSLESHIIMHAAQ